MGATRTVVVGLPPLGMVDFAPAEVVEVGEPVERLGLPGSPSVEGLITTNDGQICTYNETSVPMKVKTTESNVS